MKRALIAVLLSLILPGCLAGQTTADQTKTGGHVSDEDRIRKALDDFVEAWNRHDAKAFSMVFAEDADFTNVRGTSARGRGEIEKFHAPLFATRFRDTVQKITETKIRFIKPDAAAVDARWEMTGARGPDGQAIPLRKGLLNFVMAKEGDKWLIVVMHNMDLPAS
jgi:uncharacterized protein (TIGR02246 family)